MPEHVTISWHSTSPSPHVTSTTLALRRSAPGTLQPLAGERRVLHGLSHQRLSQLTPSPTTPPFDPQLYRILGLKKMNIRKCLARVFTCSCCAFPEHLSCFQCKLKTCSHGNGRHCCQCIVRLLRH